MDYNAIANVLAGTSTWAGATARLARAGYTLRPVGDGMSAIVRASGLAFLSLSPGICWHIYDRRRQWVRNIVVGEEC
jgi:hypothetical protein